MTEPFSMAMVGGVALTEGIKFLFVQAGELLKRWREKSAASTSAVGQSHPDSDPDDETVVIRLPTGVFDGELASVRIRYDVVDRLSKSLTRLATDLAPYGAGVIEAQPDDEGLLAKVDALRLAVEAAIGQRLTFRGEQRPSSGTPVVMGEVVVREVEGRVAGVLAGHVSSGEVHGRAQAGDVKPGGKVFGAKVDDVG